MAFVTVFKDVCTLANCQNCETYVAQQQKLPNAYTPSMGYKKQPDFFN